MNDLEAYLSHQAPHQDGAHNFVSRLEGHGRCPIKLLPNDLQIAQLSLACILCPPTDLDTRTVCM
jgi:hypothetical protein